MTVSASDILNAHILIVDDQEVNVSLFEQLLHDAGYACVASTMNPREVCALHRKNRYDLILLDLQMPGMDGFQVMEGLKTNDADGYLPVLVITAQPDYKLRALQAGAKDFISKPFDLLEVKTRIHNMLEVRLLHKQLENYNKMLEQTVQERTAELRESEARYRSLTELASDWYWEQDETGSFTKVSGPVLEMLGIRVDGDSDIGERSFAVVTGDSCEAQPTIALQKQRTGGLEPSSVNGSIANPLEERFRRIRFKDCLVRRAQCREHATFCQAYSHSCLYQDFVS